MRSIHNLTTILGSLALTWVLVLALPGVRVVRAEDSGARTEATEVAESGTCEDSAAVDGQAVVDSLDHLQRSTIKQIAAALKTHDPGPDYVELDNRGFNQPRGE